MRLPTSLLLSALLPACTASDDDSPANTSAETTGDVEASTGIVDADTTNAIPGTTDPTTGDLPTTGGVTTGDDAPSGGSTDGGSEPTGDVWVDGDGEVIGLYRVIPGYDGDAVEALVQLDADITWAVSYDRLSLQAVDYHGDLFYESSDCTGPGLVAGVAGGFREGIVALSWGLHDEALVYLVPADAQPVQVEFASWVDVLYGCLDFEVGIYPNPPTSFFREGDLQIVTPPAFTGELVLEHH